MKKLLSMTMLLTVMFLTFSACSNDDDDVATTYTLSFDVHSNLSSTVRLFEYNDNGDKIGNKSIECKAGDIHTFTADPETYKVKVYLSIGNIIGKYIQSIVSSAPASPALRGVTCASVNPSTIVYPFGSNKVCFPVSK